MRRPWRTALLALAVILLLVYSLFPLYWAVVSSLRPSALLFSPHLSLWPHPLTLEHYRSVFLHAGFLRNLLNSLIIAGGSTLLGLLVGALAAYALGRLPFPPRRAVLYLVLSMNVFPHISILSGLFVLLRSLHLFNTHLGLILSYLLFVLPLTVWILAQYFRALPPELEEAAYVDGAGVFQTFWRILLPLATPGLVSTGLLGFMAAWNEFLFALTFTVGNRVRTVPVAIALFGGASPYEIPWGSIMAASVVVTVPVILIVLLFQNRIVEGLTAGTVKG